MVDDHFDNDDGNAPTIHLAVIHVDRLLCRINLQLQLYVLLSFTALRAQD